jgi:thioredoxin reductase (NADPH)
LTKPMIQYDIAIIGAGPGGIAMAVEAVAAGILPSRVIVLEKENETSHSIRRFYPDEKPVMLNYKGFDVPLRGSLVFADTTKESILEFLDMALEDSGVAVRLGTEVYKIEVLHTADETHFAIHTGAEVVHARLAVIGIGILGKPKDPDYRIPASLRKKVHFDVNKLTTGNENVLVVGGGDSAAEYIIKLQEIGYKVTMSYRRSHFFRMLPENEKAILMLAAKGQINILWDNEIADLKRTQSQQIHVSFKENGQADTIFDHIVYALGGTTPENFLKTAGIELVDGRPLIESGESNISGLFVTGDLTAGKKGGSIALAFNTSFEIMQRICNNNYLPCGQGARDQNKPLIHNEAVYYGPPDLRNGRNIGHVELQIMGRGRVALKDLVGPKGALLFLYHGAWCETCNAFLSEAVRRQGEMEKHLPLVAVAIDNHERLRAQIRRHGFWFPVAQEDSSRLQKDIGFFFNPAKNAFEPAFYLLDGNSNIEYISMMSSGGIKPNIAHFLEKKKMLTQTA